MSDQQPAGSTTILGTRPEIVEEAISTLEGLHQEALESANLKSPRDLRDSYTIASFDSSLRHRDRWNIQVGRLLECIFALSEDCPSSAIRYFEEEAERMKLKIYDLVPCMERDDCIDRRNLMHRLAGQLAKHYGRST